MPDGISQVGFIGTGIMGEPMALRLLGAGYPVRAWNRSPEKLRALVTSGGQAADTARAAAQGADVLICMLSDGPTCDEVLFGAQAAARALAPGASLIVMSSIPVETARAQASRASTLNLRYLDAPVSGGQKRARAGDLAVMVGGAEEDFASVRPLLSVFGRPTLVGPVGTGQLAKIANQLIVAGTIAAVAEALLLAERGSANPAKVREALAGGFADSPILREHGRRMIEGDFRPGGPAKWQRKDTLTALAQAKATGLSLPVLERVDSLFGAMVEHGDGELDHSGLIRELRRLNRLPPA